MRLPSQFDPRDIPGLVIWLDSMDRSTIDADGDGLVATWRNKGTAGVGNATQSTAANKPKLVASAINSRPALQGRHDGSTASQLAIADHAGLDYTALTSFTVLQRVTDLAANETVLGKYETTGNQIEHRLLISSADLISMNATSDGSTGTQATATAVGAIATGTPVIAVMTYTPALSSVLYNRTAFAVTANPATIFNGTGVYSLFSRADKLTSSAVYIGEHLFFTSLLSNINIDRSIYRSL